MSGTDRDPAIWRAADVRETDRWRVPLDETHRAELAEAVAESRARDEPIAAITRTSFALPRLAPVLARIGRELSDGFGFALLRGLPVEGVDREDIVRATFGIGAHLGLARPQNAAGHLVGHVTDLGDDPSDPKTRIYRTAARQRFHVDSCDLVALLCLRRARAGGASSICSSLAIVEEIGRTRPDLLAELERPYIYDRKGEVPEGKDPYYPMPIVHRHRGRTSVYFARDFIESAQARFPEAPRLTERQREALDLIERLAESDEFRLSIEFRPGDLQFVHNHVILHAREAYRDGPAPDEKRHLLRLWLSAHDPRPLPPAFEERYGPIVDGEPRGGIRGTGREPIVPLEPE